MGWTEPSRSDASYGSDVDVRSNDRGSRNDRGARFSRGSNSETFCATSLVIVSRSAGLRLRA